MTLTGQDNQQPSFEFKQLIEYPDYFIYNDGRLYSKKSKRFLQGKIDNGYKMYALVSDKISKNTGRKLSKMLYAHRLVAEYFVPNPNNYLYVHHKDNNKLNNNFDNLIWIDSQVFATAVFNKKRETKEETFLELNEEEWKIFPLNTNYSISNLGRVKNNKTNYILKNDYSSKYARVSLNNKQHFYIHRMVYCTFYNDFNMDNMVIDHIDGDKMNNKLSNLQKITQSENCLKQKRFNDYRKDNESE